MSFRITGLPSEHFDHLFRLSDQELVARGVVRRPADGRTPGYPCRISLTDAREDDELLLVNYEHQPGHSPYRCASRFMSGRARTPMMPSIRSRSNYGYASSRFARSTRTR